MARAEPPKYRQIADGLRSQIRVGMFAPGERLPSKADLMARHSVSLNTVDQALRLLRGEGLVRMVQGLGTFVCDPLPDERAEQGAEDLQQQVAELADRVESLELSVRDLYSRQGENAVRKPDGKAVAHGGRT